MYELALGSVSSWVSHWRVCSYCVYAKLLVRVWGPQEEIFGNWKYPEDEWVSIVSRWVTNEYQWVPMSNHCFQRYRKTARNTKSHKNYFSKRSSCGFHNFSNKAEKKIPQKSQFILAYYILSWGIKLTPMNSIRTMRLWNWIKHPEMLYLACLRTF